MLEWALLVMFQGKEAELLGMFATEEKCRNAASFVEMQQAQQEKYPETACFMMTKNPPCKPGTACIMKPNKS